MLISQLDRFRLLVFYKPIKYWEKYQVLILKVSRQNNYAKLVGYLAIYMLMQSSAH